VTTPSPRTRWIGLLLLFGLLAGATAIRSAAIPWGIHLEHKTEPEVPRTDEGTFLGHYKKFPKHHNVYVPQTAIHALLITPFAEKILRFNDPAAITGDYFIYVVGRIASMIAGLAFLVLIFLGGRAFGLRTLSERVLATGLLAFSPLLSVYGHLFLADSLSLLWVYLSFWAFVRYAEGHEDRFAVLFAVCAGFAGSTKFATSYCVIPGLAMLFASPRPVVTGLMMAFVSAGAFYIGTGFTYDMGKLKWAHEFLTNIRSGNRIAIDIWSNLANQGAFFLTAIGLPAGLLLVGTVGKGVWRFVARLRGRAGGTLTEVTRSWSKPSVLRRRLIELMARSPMTVVNASLAAQFLLFATSGIGGFFARHVIPFVPVLVFALVRFTSELPWMRRRAALVLTLGLLLAYQIVFCLDGERAYYNDPRQATRAWLKDGRKKGLMAFYGPYSYTTGEGLPNTGGVKYLGPSPVPKINADHLLITQQASYGRYLLADHCDKIQHCWGGEPARIFFTDLVEGRSKLYRKVREFTPGYMMPEHRLLGRVVRNHPYPEVGKILVFRWREPGKEAKRLGEPVQRNALRRRSAERPGDLSKKPVKAIKTR
jgi:Dolichyl-phosphate-mannose-protein mannosyltransferase